MKTRWIVSAFIALIAYAGLAVAQEPEEISKVEVFGGYSLLRSDGHNFNGWKTAVDFNVNRWLSIAADVSGNYYSESTPTGKLKESEYAFTVGPHFVMRSKSKFVPFVYAMPGVAWENTSHPGRSESRSGFAFEAGGGLDWEVTKKVSIRLFDLTASTTRIDGHTTTKPKFATGFIFHFGKK
ncbi:MAG TPA: outer membrane beta-barrel protein [Pyrinomonadaceae bacterium]|nr:outer membrane beta-barrel protein [Pyrinomonadaceae bacterium]